MARSPSSGSSARNGLVIVLAAAVPALAAGGFVFSGRRRRQLTTAAPARPTAPAPARDEPAGYVPPPTAASMQDLLEISRRLTSAAATGNIDRIVVREAMGVVGAAGAALVRQDGHALSVSIETEPGLLVAEHLDDSTIRRVAETGQLVVQVSATERAIRNLPAALAGVPLVGGGHVQAVVVLLRPDNRPFTLAERE